MGHGGSKPRFTRLTTPGRQATTGTLTISAPFVVAPFVQIDFEEGLLPPVQHKQWHAVGVVSSAETTSSTSIITTSISTTSTFKPVCRVPVIDPPQHFADVDFQVKAYNPYDSNIPYNLFKDDSDGGYGSMERLDSPTESLQRPERTTRMTRYLTPEVMHYVLSMNDKDDLNILYMAKELYTHTHP